jgi:hypothetical protein
MKEQVMMLLYSLIEFIISMIEIIVTAFIIGFINNIGYVIHDKLIEEYDKEVIKCEKQLQKNKNFN